MGPITSCTASILWWTSINKSVVFAGVFSGYTWSLGQKILRRFCPFSFSNFTFGFHLKKLKLIQLIFNWRLEESLVVNNKDNRVFMSWNYRCDSCPLEI